MKTTFLALPCVRRLYVPETFSDVCTSYSHYHTKIIWGGKYLSARATTIRPLCTTRWYQFTCKIVACSVLSGLYIGPLIQSIEITWKRVYLFICIQISLIPHFDPYQHSHVLRFFRCRWRLCLPCRDTFVTLWIIERILTTIPNIESSGNIPPGNISMGMFAIAGKGGWEACWGKDFALWMGSRKCLARLYKTIGLSKNVS